MKALVNEGVAILVPACFCAYGSQHRKATYFLFWGLASSVSLGMCRACGGKCQHSGRAHVPITISNSEQAQVYPRGLALQLMQSVL